MRTLASIQEVVDVQPIVGADAIEVATVLGWHCVVKKSDGFKPGSRGVYVEIDSVMPAWPEFEFLKPRSYRIKTVKLRGQVSQGILFPMSILDGKRYPDDTRENPVYDFKIGQDVSTLLGVTQWEPAIPSHLSGTIKGPFPYFIPKTDETRIQSCPDVLARHKEVGCHVTEKVDGTSLTCWLKDGEFGLASRNLELADTPDNAYWMTVRALDVEGKLRAFGGDIAIQGELLGPGVQGNKYRLKELTVRWFNVFSLSRFCYYDFLNGRDAIVQMGLEPVPSVGFFLLGGHDVDELVEMSKGVSALTNTPREGIVIRPEHETTDPELGRLSFKVINPDFLLKHNE